MRGKLEQHQLENRMLASDVATIFRILDAAGIETPSPSLGAEYCSVKQYGHAHHLSNSGVMARIRRGQVEASKQGGQWLINKSAK